MNQDFKSISDLNTNDIDDKKLQLEKQKEMQKKNILIK